MKKKKPHYTPLQFAQAPKWVEYEVDMLIKSRKLHYEAHEKMGKIEDLNEQEYWRTVQTCALESFLVHYRNLKQFLNNKRPFDTDVAAEDYSDNRPCAAVTETYPNEDARINQLLAHISYTRDDLGRGSWDKLDQMEEAILDAFERYIPTIKPEFRSQFARTTEALARLRPHPGMGSTGNSADTMTVTTFRWWWRGN